MIDKDEQVLITDIDRAATVCIYLVEMVRERLNATTGREEIALLDSVAAALATIERKAGVLSA